MFFIFWSLSTWWSTSFLLTPQPNTHTSLKCVQQRLYLLMMLRRCCWSVTACSEVSFFSFFSCRAARPLIDHLPRWQKRCHNVIMRLHTFSGDSSAKTGAMGSDETIIEAWNDYQVLMQSGQRDSGARTAQKPWSRAGRTDVCAHGSDSTLDGLMLVEFINSIIYWWVEALRL